MEFGGRCRITHPVRGDLLATVTNGCPEVDEQLGLELIREAEATKLRRHEAEMAVNKLVETCKLEQVLDWELGDKAVKDLQSGVGVSWAWLRRLFPGCSFLVGVGSAGGGFNGWSQGAVESPRTQAVEASIGDWGALVLWPRP